jgi:nitrite reductase/ring-hydroxylating ferredoxin subunit
MSESDADRHLVAAESELAEGDRLTTVVNGLEVSVFNIDGEYRGYVNWCAHQAGPVCEGRISGTMKGTYDRETGDQRLEYVKEGEILNCPWHGWEYDLNTGNCLSRDDVTLPSFPVEVDEGEVFILL